MTDVTYDPCPVCGGASKHVGAKFGEVARREFRLHHCPACRFSFVQNPWQDYDAIYDEAYYSGRGADKLVDYVFEMHQPLRTVRHYEWRGILRIIRSLVNVTHETRWLDYGCGNGGLVEYARSVAGCHAVGVEFGWIRAQVVERRTPLVDADALKGMESAFDVVTLLEVIEHAVDPVALLREVRRLLKPGGLLFLTTGNARPVRTRLLEWRYVIPEIHVSFFEPQTMEHAMRRAGFRPEFPGYVPGYTDVIRFKVLKNLGVRKRSRLEALLPWPAIARVADRKFGVTAHPVGWAD